MRELHDAQAAGFGAAFGVHCSPLAVSEICAGHQPSPSMRRFGAEIATLLINCACRISSLFGFAVTGLGPGDWLPVTIRLRLVISNLLGPFARSFDDYLENCYALRKKSRKLESGR